MMNPLRPPISPLLKAPDIGASSFAGSTERLTPTGCGSRPRLLPPPGVQAPRPGAGGCEVEPDEAVEHREQATVHGRPEALRGVELEIRHRHFSSQEKGNRATEQTDEEQASV